MPEHRRLQKTITTLTDLPPEILFYNLLPRLPAESLFRCRYVCKQWHSFLTSPDFLKFHLHHVHQNHHKLLVLSTTTPCNFHTIDCQSPEDGLSASHRFPCKINPENLTIITSFHGLVCVGITNHMYDDEYSDLILWNPAIGDYKKLYKSKSFKECYHVNGTASGLYYSSCDDDYKLLRLSHDHNAYIYSLKSDSWRKLKDLNRISHLISETWGPSIVKNEKLYFLKQGKRRTEGHLSNSVLRFDTKTENFTKIATPCYGVGKRECLNLTLLQKDERIHLCLIYSLGGEKCTELGVKLWRMEDNEDWTEIVSYQIQNLCCFQKPLHLMNDGNWLTYCMHWGCHVYKLDRHLNEISYLNTYGEFDILPRGKYIETLVTPNRYMETWSNSVRLF